jgi:hypothetical protein
MKHFMLDLLVAFVILAHMSQSTLKSFSRG